MTFRRRSLDGIEIARLDCTGHTFPKHAHDEFVIGANIVGREHIWLDRRNLEAERGQVTLYNPGEVQAADARGEPWSFVSLYVEPRAIARLAALDPAVVFARPILRDEVLADLVRVRAGHALQSDIGDGEAMEGIVDLLGRLLDAAGSRRPAADRAVGPEVSRVAERLLDEMAAPPRLEDLAEAEGLTPVQLVRAFTRARGLPPFAWLNTERLRQARRALLRGERLSHLAADLGFADQAHLTRRFKAMFGVPPATWARGEG